MVVYKKHIDMIIAVMAMAAVVVTTTYFFRYEKPTGVPLQSAMSVLTNKEEAVLQQQIADIIASKRGADCATLSNEIYRLACEQILNVPQGSQTPGVLLQTVSAEPMTEAQLTKLLQNASSQPRYSITKATTTP